MLIALLIGLLFSVFGDASPEVVKTRIEASIEDSARRDSAVEIVDAISACQTEYLEQLRTDVEQLASVHADFDSTKADYAQIFESAANQRQAFHAEALKQRDNLRETLNEEEWKTVFTPTAAK